jgi:hypothetical protein
MTLQSLLSNQVAINTLALTQTGGKRKKAWTQKYSALPASIQPASSNTQAIFRRNGMQVSHTIYIGSPGATTVFNLSITQGEQVTFQPKLGSPLRIFEIRGVENPVERNRYLILHCMEKKA